MSAVRLAQAFQQVGYKPDLYLRDPTDYLPDYVNSGGSAVDGTVVFLNFVPFEEAAHNKEMSLYVSWLQQVNPGADPTFFGVFSWSAARLFVEKAAALGGNLSRSTLIDALSKTDNWTANGMTAPQHVGSKQTGDCHQTVHPDQHSIAIGSNHGKPYVVVGDDGGMYRRPVRGHLDQYGHATDWSSLSDGSMDVLQYYSVDAGRDRGGLAISGGLQDNGQSVLRPGDRIMGSNFGGDGGDTIVDPANGCNIAEEYVYLRITPSQIRAWREANELEGRLLMREGRWLD